MNKQLGKRVLMLLENADFPGDDRVRHEAATLSSAGYRVIVIAPAIKKSAWHQRIGDIEVYGYPEPPFFGGMLGYLWEYAYSMCAHFVVSLYVWLKHGFDIVHTAQPPDTFAFVAGFFKLFGKSYVLDLHDLAPELYLARFHKPGSHFAQRMLFWLEKFSFRLADHVICTNQSYRQVAMERGEVPETQITIVRNGPDMEELKSTEVDPSLRNRGKMIIGYVGVTGVQDGVENLLRAVHQLRCDLGRTDFLCVIVGSGSAMPHLRELSVRLGIESDIVFTGWVRRVSEVARYLNTMDICVAPEPSDTYNQRSTAVKVMEYMAAGKPVVSSDLPEHRQTAGAAAVYARPGDALDLARKIAALMDDPGRRAELGRIGRARIDTELAWSFQARKLEQAFAAIVAQRARRAGRHPS